MNGHVQDIVNAKTGDHQQRDRYRIGDDVPDLVSCKKGGVRCFPIFCLVTKGALQFPGDEPGLVQVFQLDIDIGDIPRAFCKMAWAVDMLA